MRLKTVVQTVLMLMVTVLCVPADWGMHACLCAENQEPELGPETVVPEREYPLEIDVLTQPQPSYRINAQKWGRVFQEIGYVVRFREGRAGERTTVENVERSGQEITRIVGLMESDGRISFRGRKFAMSEPDQITAWFEELKRFGANGPPNSSPTWGLNDTQFAAVTRLLSVPVEEPVVMKSAVEALDSMQLPAVVRLRFTDAARAKAVTPPDEQSPGVSELGEDAVGMSKGTVLAIVLAQYGLGYRPLVNPEGGYILEIDAGDESSNFWPIGWKTKEAINVAVPEIFKPITVDVEDVPLTAIVDLLSERLKVRDFYSTAALRGAKIDVAELTYSRKPEKIPPSRLMSLMGDRFQMGMDIRTDESGKCFLWVTTKSDWQAFRQRFAHVIPGKP